jgi:hypothetical protein
VSLFSCAASIPVVSAEIAKRKISVTINTIGGSVEEMLLNYGMEDFKELERPFFRLLILSFHTPKITSILYCIFHSSDRREAFVLNITNLDELLTVLLLNISEEQRPSQYTYQAQEGYIELPHNTTSNLYNSRKKRPLP